MPAEVAKHGFWFQKPMCKKCPGPWGSAQGYVEAAAEMVAIWKPKLDALAAKLPAGNLGAGLAGIQNHFNAGIAAGAGVAAVPGLGKDPAVLCPGGGANRFQELQLCFSKFPKNVQAGQMAGTNTPALLIDCAAGGSNCAAANVPID